MPLLLRIPTYTTRIYFPNLLIFIFHTLSYISHGKYLKRSRVLKATCACTECEFSVTWKGLHYLYTVNPRVPSFVKGTHIKWYVFFFTLWLKQHISNCNILRSSAVLWPRRESKRNSNWSGSPDGGVSPEGATTHAPLRRRERRLWRLIGDEASQGFELVKDSVWVTPLASQINV